MARSVCHSVRPRAQNGITYFVSEVSMDASEQRLRQLLPHVPGVADRVAIGKE